MKKFMKVCAVLALILVVTGFAMALTAKAIHGPFTYSWLKSSIQGLDSGIRFDVEDNVSFDRNNNVFEGDTEQSFSAEDVRELDLEAGACSFSIEESEDEDFHVKVQGAGKYQGYVSDGTLHIRVICQTSLENGSGKCKVCLSVPEGFFLEQATLSLGAGEIIANAGLQAEQVNIELGAGHIDLSDLTANELEAEVGMGALSLRGDILESADLECAMGSIEMKLDGAASDFNYQVALAMGDVQVGERSFSGMAGEWDIDNNSSRDIIAECGMGSISVSFAE